MRHSTTWPIAILFAASMTGLAWAQDAGPSPHGVVPGPNATPPGAEAHSKSAENPVQPVPGAMPGSDTVPSTLSEKHAADDKLIIAAYTFKNFTPEQRRAIYQALNSERTKYRASQAHDRHRAALGHRPCRHSGCGRRASAADEGLRVCASRQQGAARGAGQPGRR